MEWKDALRAALAGYAELNAAGRVLDCHYVHVDDTRTLSYNGSQYMFFIHSRNLCTSMSRTC